MIIHTISAMNYRSVLRCHVCSVHELTPGVLISAQIQSIQDIPKVVDVCLVAVRLTVRLTFQLAVPVVTHDVNHGAGRYITGWWFQPT